MKITRFCLYGSLSNPVRGEISIEEYPTLQLSSVGAKHIGLDPSQLSLHSMDFKLDKKISNMDSSEIESAYYAS